MQTIRRWNFGHIIEDADTSVKFDRVRCLTAHQQYLGRYSAENVVYGNLFVSRMRWTEGGRQELVQATRRHTC